VITVEQIADYDKAIAIDPKGNTYFNRGLLKAELEDHRGAITGLQ
jgi:hypothetical protein